VGLFYNAPKPTPPHVQDHLRTDLPGVCTVLRLALKSDHTSLLRGEKAVGKERFCEPLQIPKVFNTISMLKPSYNFWDIH